MRYFFVLTFLSVSALCLGVEISGLPTDPGLSSIEAQPETREVYESGTVVFTAATKQTQWHLAYTDPDPAPEQIASCSSSVVLVFRLPDREGKLIEVDTLTSFLAYCYNARLDRVDIYGLRSMPASTDANDVVTAGDHFTGEWARDPNGTPIDDGYIVTADVATGNNSTQKWFGTDTEGSLRLSCWLNSLYDEGAAAGDYVLIRMSYNTKYSVYTNASFDNFNYDAVELTEHNPKIFYKLVDTLPTCPDPIVPIRQCIGDNTGDVTGDCVVDMEDLAVAAAEWLRCDRLPARLCD